MCLEKLLHSTLKLEKSAISNVCYAQLYLKVKGKLFHYSAGTFGAAPFEKNSKNIDFSL